MGRCKMEWLRKRTGKKRKMKKKTKMKNGKTDQTRKGFS
jgi:hypothetical protein